jgi:hypothetical protein
LNLSGRFSRAGARTVRGDRDERVHLRVEPLDSRETCVDHLHRRHAARPNQIRQFPRGHGREFRRHSRPPGRKYQRRLDTVVDLQIADDLELIEITLQRTTDNVHLIVGEIAVQNGGCVLQLLGREHVSRLRDQIRDCGYGETK